MVSNSFQAVTLFLFSQKSHRVFCQTYFILLSEIPSWLKRANRDKK